MKRAAALVEDDITVCFLDYEPYVADVADVSTLMYEFCDETLSDLDTFVYRLVVKSLQESDNPDNRQAAGLTAAEGAGA